ncbi:unnamed protein product [Rotaria magnacalcarata]
MVKKSEQEELVNDVESLQLAQDGRIFIKASNLFVKKWSKKEPNFIEYFQNEWLTIHNAWYEGVGHFTPSANNALEATNNIIKKKNTLGERLLLSRVKVLAFEIVEKWSKCYERVQYDIPAGEETKITNVGTDVVKKMKWYTFDQYQKKAFTIWSVTLPVDKLKWLDGVCTCAVFFKKYMCKHVVGMTIRLDHCKPPPAAKNAKIGDKKIVVVDHQNPKKCY